MLRVALVADYREEGWTSMDLVGDMLFAEISSRHSTEVAVTRLEPRFRRRLTAFANAGRDRRAWNADRLINRVFDYPQWLRKRADQFDLFHIVDHSYAHLANVLPAGRAIVTCHDLDAFRCLLEPDLEPRPRWFRAMVRRILNGLQRAAHVQFVSETTRAQALDRGLVKPDKATVIHNGVHPEMSAVSKLLTGQVAEMICSDAPLILNVGSTISRKRIDILLRVFARVHDKFPKARLLRVGGGFTPEQKTLADQLKITGHVAELPFLSVSELAAVYHRATLLLQTSEAEGFGLPVVEAMACGCPVVATDIPALREVGSRAAVYCPVGDIDAYAAAVDELLNEQLASPSLWQKRRTEGRENSRRFTWTAAARSVVDIYRKLESASRRTEGAK